MLITSLSQSFVFIRLKMCSDKIIITGASGGLGSELVKSWDGKKIVKIGRSSDSDIICDFKAPDALRTLMDYYLYDRKHIPKENISLVLCAADISDNPTNLFCPSKFFNPSDYTDVYNTNVVSHLTIIRGLIPIMIQAQYGRVVWLSGGGAAYGNPELFAYSLSKVAVVRAVENIAMELKDKIEDFSIIALAPGAMETEMLKKVRAAGGYVKTTVDIKEPVTFINNFLQMEKEQAKKLSGRFIHVKDDLRKIVDNDLGKLRRTE